MSPELAVALGGAVGAPARYLLDQAVPRPYGVVLVNLLGSLLAGVVAGAAPPAALFLAVGVLGSFTTASTLAWDVLDAERPARLLTLHLVPGLALAAVGFATGRAL
ncbi:MAG: crcB 2 [Frankiales bacterium]|nr:crcB 2 [Frankiales bacterium]